MKISPMAPGNAGMPSQDLNIGAVTVGPDRIERAKAIAQGLDPVELPQPSGDPQVDKINTKRIKMKTNVSPDRPAIAPEAPEVPEATPAMSTLDVSEPAPVVEETKPLSPQFAALAKAKRALQVERAQFEKEKASLQKSLNPDEYVSKADLKSKPLDVLLGNGVTYDQLTESLINQQSGITPEVNALKAEINALKEMMESQFQSRDKAAEQQVLADLKREADAITREGDQFEAVRQAKAQSEVVKLIHRVWQKGWPEQGFKPGDVMDIEKAAEFVENQLIEEALPFAKLSKVQSRLTPAQEAQIVQQVAAKPNVKVMRTLTNRDTATPVMDRRSRALAAFNGTLKKG
jgi:hypothetical protein